MNKHLLSAYNVTVQVLAALMMNKTSKGTWISRDTGMDVPNCEGRAEYHPVYSSSNARLDMVSGTF